LLILTVSLSEIVTFRRYLAFILGKLLTGRSLATSRYDHFKISTSYGQLDQSFLHLTGVLLLLRTGSEPPSLYMLARFLHMRWKRLKQPDDIKYCVNDLRHLRDQRLQVVNISESQDRITSSLVSALSLGRCGQWRMKMGNIWSKISTSQYCRGMRQGLLIMRDRLGRFVTQC
jgi:hypothetical protein